MAAWLFFVMVRISEAGLTVKRRVVAQGLVEYSIIIMLMAIVVIGIMSAVGRTLCTTWYVKLANSTAWDAATVPVNCP